MLIEHFLIPTLNYKSPKQLLSELTRTTNIDQTHISHVKGDKMESY